jgi:LysR family transcriptional regulator, hydrogen peroxide-inducible genes activator
MNLRELKYLVTLAEELHFHKAAARCFVSQPTLSGQIKKLEEELGVLLIDRSNRQVVMTDAGRAVAEQARVVLSHSKILKEIAQSFQDSMISEIQLGLIPTVAPYLLPRIMSPLKQQFPNLKLWLHERQTHVLLDKLRNAELDLLILALPVDTKEFSELVLFEEPFWLAVSKQNKLSKKKQVHLKDLNHQEILLLEEGHCLREHALDICYTAGASEFNSFHATSLETLRHMVGEGMGMTLLPELAVLRSTQSINSDSTNNKHKCDIKYKISDHTNISYIPFAKPVPTRQIGMVFRKGSYREKIYQQIAQVIMTEFL